MLWIIIFLLIAVIVFKYSIDTKSTIKALREDRDRFRAYAWKILSKEEAIKKQEEEIKNLPYNELKNKINLLIKDLVDTDFNTFENIKEEVISALQEIDSYGEINDQGNNQ